MAVTEIVAKTNTEAQKALMEATPFDVPHATQKMASIYLAIDTLKVNLPETVQGVVLAVSCSRSSGISHITRAFSRKALEASGRDGIVIPTRFLLHLHAEREMQIELTLRDAFTPSIVVGSTVFELGTLSLHGHDCALDLYNDKKAVVGTVNARYTISSDLPFTANGSSMHYLPTDNSAGLVGLPTDIITGIDAEKFKSRRLNISVYKVSGVNLSKPIGELALMIQLGPHMSQSMSSSTPSVDDPLEGRVDTFEKGISFPYPTEGYKYVFFRLVDAANPRKVYGEAQVEVKRVICFRQNCQVGSVTLRAPPSDEDTLECEEVGELYYKLNRIIETDPKPEIMEVPCDPQTPTAIAIA